MAVLIWSPYERALWGLAIGIGVICSGFYINRGVKRENRWEKTLMTGFGIFILCLSLARIFYFLGEMEIIGAYKNQGFYGDFSKVSSSYEFYNRMYYLVIDIGLIFFFFLFEFYIKRTKFLLTIVNVVIAVIIQILPFNSAYMLHNYIFFPFSMLIFIIIFLLLAKNSQSEFKAVAPLILSGLMMGALAAVYSGPEFKELGVIPLVIPPILFIFGTLLLIAPIIIDPKNISESFIYGVIGFLIFFAGIMTIGFFYAIALELFIPIVVVITILIYSFLKIIKMMRIAEADRIKNDVPSVIGMFARPKKLTEEEVSISKEKKTCLVCKGRLVRAMYICPECSTFYCNKCSDALTNLENACWVCGTAIDESKPVKPFEPEIKEKKEKADKLKQQKGK